ncbi:MAG TPA: cobalamin-independent methionine synthase II family protein [Vineibacter sp.]|nr:cobalamin-independent methionine synthase II family protein [Vineibacter sp.]
MQQSVDRILTSHVGSLPRSPTLTDLLIRQERDEAIDTVQLARETRAAVAEVVRRQIEAGVDIINDGEQPRVGFQTYVPQRMKGFGGASNRPSPPDYREFPGFAKIIAARFPRRSKVRDAPQAVAEVRYDDLSAAKEECDLFEAASGAPAGRYVERFMTAASPGIIATTMLNAYYDSHEKYVFALAREMKKEYDLIVARGYILQIDAPDLAMERVVLFQDKSLAEFQAIVEIHVAAINAALADVPRDRVRLHCCWGNWEGPHLHDVPVKDILPLLYQAKVGGLSLEFANPRHQHEYAEIKRLKPPAELILLPGVLDSTTNYVEHPQVVANRICEAVDAVGDRTRVIASTDCGFGTFAGYEFVAADVVWAKLQAAAEGARIASKRLWG